MKAEGENRARNGLQDTLTPRDFARSLIGPRRRPGPTSSRPPANQVSSTRNSCHGRRTDRVAATLGIRGSPQPLDSPHPLLLSCRRLVASNPTPALPHQRETPERVRIITSIPLEPHPRTPASASSLASLSLPARGCAWPPLSPAWSFPMGATPRRPIEPWQSIAAVRCVSSSRDSLPEPSLQPGSPLLAAAAVEPVC
ncbi:hypothetical protein CDD83_2070 [Cordyceps sp. RAO-2017]|nr:hypothetical protein CDD83_2070 [Cordyceps sp. RAO-2017]